MASRSVRVKIELDTARIRRSVRRMLIASGAPVHRADVPVDSCVDIRDRACAVCIEYPLNADGRHRAPGVLTHYVMPHWRNTPNAAHSVCGKVWRPNPNAVSEGNCETCEAIVASGWFK